MHRCCFDTAQLRVLGVSKRGLWFLMILPSSRAATLNMFAQERRVESVLPRLWNVLFLNFPSLTKDSLSVGQFCNSVRGSVIMHIFGSCNAKKPVTVVYYCISHIYMVSTVL